MAILLGSTTIAGHQAIHAGNIANYSISQTTADGRYLLLSGGTLTGQLTVASNPSGDHGIRVGAVRGSAVGSQTGDYIMLYERVHIGHPNGWGAEAAAAPAYGLGVWGSIHVSQSNATGGGIIIADDGDIVDLNDAFLSMRFSSGVRIYSANRGGSSVIQLGSNGVVTANTSVNAPIFYDSNDTNYYLDPNSTSVLNAIRFGTSANNGTLSGSSDWGLRLSTNDGYIQFGPANTSYAHIYTDRSSFYFNKTILVNNVEVSYVGHTHDDRYYTESEADSRFINTTGDTMTGDLTLKYSTADVDDYNALIFATGSDDYIIKASSSRGVFGRSSFGWHLNSSSAFGVYSSGWQQLLGVQGDSGNVFNKGRFVVGGNFNNNAYNSVGSTRLHFGGGDSDANDNYYIGTNLQDYAGNYTKLDLRWHTGIRMGARPNYGGIRFFNNETFASRIMSIGETDANIRIDNTLFVFGDVRAPIFYDSNDTNYYIDPNATSRIVHLDSLGYVGANTSETRDKFRVWNSGSYSIGMKSGYTYGHLGNEYAMSFQMDTTPNRGFWWGRSNYSDSQGAASLTTDGRMVIAKSLSVGEGNSVTAPASTPLYVKGSTNNSDVFAVDGINGRLFTVTDSLSDSLFSVNTIAGLPVIEAFADNTVVIGKYGNATIFNPDGTVTFQNEGIKIPYYNGGIMWFRTNTHWESISGIDVIGGSGEFRISSDTGSISLRVDGDLLSSGDIYLGTRGVYLSSWLNQALLTTSSPTFGQVYNNGWFRNNASNTGLYNEVTTMHLSSNANGYWDMSSTTSVSAIRFWTGGHVSAIRGYVYANTSNEIGFLNTGGNWSLRVENNGNTHVTGYLYVNGVGTSSSIYMQDTDEGQREIHCNSNRIGFLTQAGGWGAWCEDNGAWSSAVAMYAPIFYDSNDTNYYVDPASTTRINSTIIYGGTGGTSPRLTFITTDDDDTNKYIGMVGYWTQIGCHANEGLRLINSNGTEQFYVRGGTSGNEAWFRGTVIGSGDMRAPIFYDSNDTNYYVDPNGNSFLSTLRVNDASNGVSLHVGVGSTHGVYTLDNARKYLVVSGDYYPHMALVARYANNTNHGAVFSFVGSEGGSARQWNLGIANENPFLFSIGYNTNNDTNPHYGIGDGWSGNDADHARLSIDRSGNTKIRGMLYVNGTSGGISTGSAVIHAGNIGSQSVNYAASAGNASTVSSITGNTGLMINRFTPTSFIDGLTTSNFRSVLFNTTSNGAAISAARWNSVPAPLSGLNQYGTMIAWSGESDTHGFVATDYISPNIIVGGGYGNIIAWTATLIHSSNIGSQSVATAGTVSRTIAANTEADLIYTTVGDNDFFRIRAGGASNAGFVEIATADDGTEPIYVRQYTGTFTSLTRTATILDGSGNTNFPNTVYAAGYRGNANVGGTGEATWHPAGIYSGGTQWLYGTTFRNGAETYGQANIYFNNNYGHGMVGLYDSFRFQGVFSMGAAYILPADGTSPSNLYGLSWSHPNAGGEATRLNDHGLLVMINGKTVSALSRNIWAEGDIIAYSDARVKDNVEVIDNAIEKVKAIRGVTFTRKDLADKSRKAGVIAQEVLAVLPEVVTESADGAYSVAYGNLTALLIEAIKEQQAQIDELKKRLRE
jgi:hypothetical protein